MFVDVVNGKREKMKKYTILFITVTLALAPLVWADRTELNPGFNMFSPQQDVEVGQQTSQEAEQQLKMLNNSRVDRYLNDLGRKLAAKAPGEKYPYQFKAVNDRDINAFALPGGFLYINRGIIEAADNEAQLAGVIAHEISHVALRHGTNQASKAYIAQVPLAILGGALGSNSTGAVLAQIGAGFAVDSVLLKYSRTAESQADVLGTQILYDAGYDPRAMGQFLRKLAASSQGGPPTFFSSHPDPENRDERVEAEIVNLGGYKSNLKTDSNEFQDIKRYASGLTGPPATNGTSVAQGNTGTGQTVASGLRILNASYGAKDRFIDVTQRMQSSVQNNRLNLQVTNSSMGGDPIGEAKTLLLRYEWAGRTYDIAVPEKQQISIPTEQQMSGTNSQTVTYGLRILNASYGAKDRFIDVTQLMQSSVQNNRLNLQVSNSTMGRDPYNGEAKALLLRYEWAGRTYDIAVPENQQISIPTDQQVSVNNPQAGAQPDSPSSSWRTFENSVLQIQYPENWNAFGPGDVSVTISPERGIVDDGQGNKALAYGLIVNIYEPIINSRSGQQLQSDGYALPSGTSRSTKQDQQLLENDTSKLIDELRHTNSGMRIVNQVDNFRVDGQWALSTYLSNASPTGGSEMNWLVTMRHPEGLLFLVFVAPDSAFRNYEKTFQSMLYSVRFR